MREQGEAATLPEVNDNSLPALVARNVPHDCTDGPSRGALLGFYAELKRIAQAKAPGNGGEGDEACRKG